MKYTFILPSLTAFALAAALSFSSGDVFAASVQSRGLSKAPGPNPNTGQVTCYINHDQTVVRLRRFVNFVQISQHDYPIVDYGFGIEKEIAVITNYCKAATIDLCADQYPSPQTISLSKVTATGNLFPTPFVWKCQ